MAGLRMRCLFHPERAGIGVCTRCGHTLCEECATRVDGILHCRDCLAYQPAAAHGHAWRSLSALPGALLLAPLAWAALGTLLYLLVATIALAREWWSELSA
jgi:hypothetical protein